MYLPSLLSATWQARYTDASTKLRVRGVPEWIQARSLNPYDVLALLRLRRAAPNVVE